jgi:hypothetical protein
MNLKDTHIHEDNGDHFVVSHKGGAPFRVAKAGFNKQDLEKAHAHHLMCQGGSVQKFDTGGDVKPSTDWANPDALPSNIWNAVKGANPSTWQNPIDAIAGRLVGAARESPAPAPAAPPATDPNAIFTDLANDKNLGATANAPNAPAAPGVGGSGAAGNPATKTATTGGRGMGLEGDIVTGEKLKEGAEQTNAQNVINNASAVEQLQRQQVDQLRDESQRRQAKFAEYQQRADTMAQDIASGKVNPNQFWESRSTGQKFGGIMAMILGGLGGGLTGSGKNAGADAINEAISRDIDAQKENINNKKSLLNYYMAQGHNIEDASRLSAADIKDQFAGLLQANASKFAGPQAQAQAQMAIGGSKQEAAKERMALRVQASENDARSIDTRLKMMQMQMMPNQMAAEMAGRSGAVIPDNMAGYIDHGTYSKVPGGYARANSPKDKETLDEGEIAATDVENALKRIEGLKHEWGVPGFGTSAEGAEALQDYTAAIKSLRGKSGIATTREEGLVDSSMGNPTKITRSADETQRLVNAARKSKDLHIGAIRRRALIGGEAAAAGGAEAANRLKAATRGAAGG